MPTMTTAQDVLFAADIRSPANAAALGAAIAANDDQFISDWYNTATVAYWVWKTRLTKAEITQQTSVDGTVFNWTGAGFITRAQGERDAWRELFDVASSGGPGSAGGAASVNPSLVNVRQAFADIFSGATAPAPANRTHLLTVARRLATRFEQVFAVGLGTTASPSVMALEGAITYRDVARVLRGVQ